MTIRFDFLPVAGEAILVTTDECTILLDTGSSHPFKKLFKRSNYYKDYRETPCIDICIITHIDFDHINGAIHLLGDKKFYNNFKQIWFNEPESAKLFNNGSGKVHAGHGATLQEAIRKNSNIEHIHNISTLKMHNNIFQEKIKNITKNINFDLLSPSEDSLNNLYKKWNPEKYKKNNSSKKSSASVASDKIVVNCSFDDLNSTDTSIPNGSSISFLMTYKNNKFILLADAHIDIVYESIKSMGYSEKYPLEVDFVKLSHHGSKKNISVDFVKIVKTKKYIICRNQDYRLPNIETIFNICCNRSNKEDDIIIYVNKKFNNSLNSISQKSLNNYKVKLEAKETLIFGG